jgi:branched-chain amino acid transport system ATP-binding protein
MTAAATAAATSGPAADVPELSVSGLTVRFAGLTALEDVGFTVAPGSIHAVIGPNGAGKSTCFNVLSGVYKATEGSVRFGDRELTGLAPHQVGALGIARTFQNLALSAELTVEDNLLLGRHRLTRTGFTAAGLRLPQARREERRHRERVREFAEFAGIAERLHEPAGALPYGDRKRVEMARALCTEPRLLMLDEPVAGMNATERLEMAELILAAREGLGISILLVEHDMGMVMRLADEVTVLNFGRRIVTGAPDEVRRDPEVLRAYLGGTDDPSEPDAAPAQHGKHSEHSKHSKHSKHGEQGEEAS